MASKTQELHKIDSEGDTCLQPAVSKVRELHEIDSEGDVYLELSIKEFRVSSKILSSASKVFEVMFLPKFREGSELASGHSCRVPLVDDNPDAMLILMKLMHHKSAGIRFWNTAESILDTVILADQYDCIGAVYFWVEAQTFRMIRDRYPFQSVEKEDTGMLLVAYLVDNLELFDIFTKRIILWTTQIEENQFSDMLPTGLIGTLKSYQEIFKKSVWDILGSMMDHLLDLELGMDSKASEFHNTSLSHTEEEWTSITRKIQRLNECKICTVADHLWRLKVSEISPLNRSRGNLSLGTLVRKLQMFEAEKMPTTESSCENCRTGFEELIRQSFKPAFGFFHGLCIDCVRHGKKGPDEKKEPCRGEHTAYRGITEAFTA